MALDDETANAGRAEGGGASDTGGGGASDHAGTVGRGRPVGRRVDGDRGLRLRLRLRLRRLGEVTFAAVLIERHLAEFAEPDAIAQSQAGIWPDRAAHAVVAVPGHDRRVSSSATLHRTQARSPDRFLATRIRTWIASDAAFGADRRLGVADVHPMHGINAPRPIGRRCLRFTQSRGGLLRWTQSRATCGAQTRIRRS